MNYIFPPHTVMGLPIAGKSETFPVRRVYCVGRNYAAHAREMGFDPDREPPFFFCKANDAQSVVAVPATAIRVLAVVIGTTAAAFAIAS